ncbi:autotransporter-associated beta strand repeat-containing protein [Flavobacterium cyanobacteriorum]|nr:autotransporter-associated beta strand repeat-containing protein [Flavobacterium cyanobacteriorum]
MKKKLLLLLFMLTNTLNAQVTLNYTTQTVAFNQTHTVFTGSNYFAGTFDNGAAELGVFANGSGSGFIGNPGVATFRTFTTNTFGTQGISRPMQVGDEFVITAFVNNSTNFFDNGTAGISFNGNTTYSNYGALLVNQRARFQINTNGNWFPAASSAGSGFATPNQDVTFRLKLTSARTANLTISSANSATSFDMVLAGTLGATDNITSFAIWNQTSGNSNNMFWKNASIRSTGTVEIGGGNGSSTFDGIISNGTDANSTTIVSVNELIKQGTGTITLAAANTYTGNTRITGGTLRLSGSGRPGIGSNVFISAGATFDLNGVDTSVASVRETGFNNGGSVSLGSGNLTITGGWTGTIFQNSISGSGTITKQGSGTLSLYGTQGYTGSTTVSGDELSTAVAMASTVYNINGGTFTVGAANIIPDAASVNLSSGTFNVGFDETIGNLTLSGGTLSITAGRVLTINGNLTVTGSATLSLGAGAAIRYGTGGNLIYNLPGSLTTGAEWPATFGPNNVTVDNGTITLSADRAISGNLNINAGTLDIGANTLSRAVSGGTLTLANGAILRIGGTGTFPANFATHTLGASSTVEYYGSNQVVAALNSTDYGNLTISGTGTKSLSANTAARGNVAINASTLDIASNTLTNTGTGATFSIANGATLRIGGTGSFPAGYANYTLGATSTTEYYGGAQSVSTLGGSQYGNLILSGSGAKTLAGNVVTAGNATVTNVALTVVSGQNLTVGGNLVNSGGNVSFLNNANLLQGAATTTNNNSGNVVVFRNSSPLFRQDYTMWSSPVAAQNLFGFSPNTLPNRFYTYNTATDQYIQVPGLGTSSATTFTPGTGYLIRMPNGSFDGQGNPTGTFSTNAAEYQQGITTMTFNGRFSGLPNNGNITVSLSTAGNGYNFVGNPYPSPISLAVFRAANTNAIDGNVWIWRKTNNSPSSAYVTINSVGIYTSNGEPEQEDPLGIIRTGQGFIVKMKNSPGSLNALFTNGMRSTDTANQFFRMNAPETESHGIWLNLTGPGQRFSQMYTGYVAGATNEEDEGLDAPYINDADFVLAPVLNGKEFIIHARALPFTDTDVVPLQLRTAQSGTYEVAIGRVNGLFGEGQTVYLKDNAVGTVHNFADGAYTFTTGAGTFSNRFEIVFANNTLNRPTITAGTSLSVYRQGDTVVVSAPQEDITGIEVYDIRGRLVYSRERLMSTEVLLDGLVAKQQVLLLKITTVKGIYNRKLVH